MAGQPLAFMKQLDRIDGNPGIQLLLEEGVRYRIIMAADLDVTIDVDSHHFPFGIDIGYLWQWLQCRIIQGLELFRPTTRQLAEGALVQFDQQGRNRLIQFGKREKGLLA